MDVTNEYLIESMRMTVCKTLKQGGDFFGTN